MTLERHPAAPVVTRRDIPAVPGRLRDPSSVFNPAAALVVDDVVLLLRVQTPRGLLF